MNVSKEIQEESRVKSSRIFGPVVFGTAAFGGFADQRICTAPESGEVFGEDTGSVVGGKIFDAAGNSARADGGRGVHSEKILEFGYAPPCHSCSGSVCNICNGRM